MSVSEIGYNKRKLNCEKILELKERISNGESIRGLAKENGISPKTLTNAINGITYKECKEKK